MARSVSITESQQNIDARPSGNISTGLLCVLPLHHPHEGLLMIDGEKPVSGLKICFQQSENL
jgi:hypothetical protein